MKLSHFLSMFKVRSVCERANDNPNLMDEKWKNSASHYKCKIKRGKSSLSVPYSMGSAHKNPPTAKDIMESLALDASAYEAAGGDFDRLADDLGADKDCKCSKRTFKAVKKQSAALKRVLGGQAYRELLEKVNLDE